MKKYLVLGVAIFFGCSNLPDLPQVTPLSSLIGRIDSLQNTAKRDSANPRLLAELGKSYLFLSEIGQRASRIVSFRERDQSTMRLGAAFGPRNNALRAIMYLERAIRYDSLNPGVYVCLGDAYLQNFSFAFGDRLGIDFLPPLASIKSYYRALAIDSSNIQAILGLLKIWSALEEKDSIVYYRQKLARSPSKAPEVFYFKAIESQGFERERLIDQAIQAGLFDPTFFEDVASEMASRRTVVDRIFAYSQVIDQVPKAMSAPMMLGMIFFQKKDYQKEIARFSDSVVAHYPYSEDAYDAVVVSHLLAGDKREAQAWFLQGMDVLPYYGVHSEDRYLTLQHGEYIYDSSVRGVPRYLAGGTRAHVRDVLGWYKRRQAIVSQWNNFVGGILERRSDDPRTYVEYALSDSKEPNRSLRKALEIDSSYFPAYAELVAAEISGERYDEAERLLNTAFGKNLSGAWVLPFCWRIAAEFVTTKNFDRMKTFWIKVYSANKDNKEIDRILRLMDFYGRSGDSVAIVRTLKGMVGNGAVFDAAVYDALGAYYQYALNQDNSAKYFMVKALQTLPARHRYAVLQYHHMRQGDFQSAVELDRAFLSRAGESSVISKVLFEILKQHRGINESWTLTDYGKRLKNEIEQIVEKTRQSAHLKDYLKAAAHEGDYYALLCLKKLKASAN